MPKPTGYQNRIVFVVSSFFFIKLLFLLEGEGVLGVYCKTQKLHVVINIAPLYISDKIVVCNLFSFVDLVAETNPIRLSIFKPEWF